MADFIYRKAYGNGLTVQTEKIVLAGTVEAGDIVAADLTKADASDTNVLYLAMEAGDAADEIIGLPLVPGMVLECKSQDEVVVGNPVGIAIEAVTNRQIADEDAANMLFRVSKGGAIGAQIYVSPIATYPVVDADTV